MPAQPLSRRSRLIEGRLSEKPTPAQMRMLPLLALGWMDSEIAEYLRLSLYTVKRQVRNMMRDQGVRTRTAMVVLALNQGWLEMPSPTELRNRSPL